MLNIKIYKGVPFQSNYNNVCLFNDTNAVETYLERYKIGTITGIAMFYANENKINLTQYYEDANYMLIEDTNAVRQKKFYFINNMTFKSASDVEYNITCDIWNTYSFDINIQESLCVRAHCDVMNIPQYKVNGNNLKSNKILPFNNAECITNYLIEPQTNNIKGSLIAIVNVSQQGGGTNGVSIIYRECFTLIEGIDDVRTTIEKLNINTFELSGTTQNYDFNVIKAYFIPNLHFEEKLIENANFTQPYDHANAGVDIIIEHTHFKWFRYNVISYDTQNQSIESKFLEAFINLNLISNTIYKNNINRKNFEGKRVIIGALNNNKEISTTGLTNINDTMSLNMYILSGKQIEIMLEFNNNKINMTSNFEIPYLNDEYILYLNQNQNQIDVANKQNSLNVGISLATIGAGLLLSPATSGGSLALAMGAISATSAISKGILSEQMKNAQLEDAQNKFDRLDATNNNCLITIIHGVGAFTLDDNDNFTINQYNKFGNETQYYITRYKPFNPNYRSLYNFYYIKFNSVVLHGNFNEQTKNILTTIFENGVRIWTDTSEYLNDINYLKD